MRQAERAFERVNQSSNSSSGCPPETQHGTPQTHLHPKCEKKQKTKPRHRARFPRIEINSPSLKRSGAAWPRRHAQSLCPNGFLVINVLAVPVKILKRSSFISLLANDHRLLRHTS